MDTTNEVAYQVAWWVVFWSAFCFLPWYACLAIIIPLFALELSRLKDH